MINEAKNYFYNLHDVECNQKYNGTLPYSFHLECVIKQAEKFIYLIPNVKLRSDNSFSNDTLREAIYVACYGHDAIEDARITYNDIKQKFGEEIAEIIYCCTEEKGRNRDERHNQEYFNLLIHNRSAMFVKLCDIIANVKFSLLTNSSMYEKYKKEYNERRRMLYRSDYNDMFVYLDNLFKI